MLVVLRTETNQGLSGLLAEYGVWAWKIERDLKGENEQAKDSREPKHGETTRRI
jgi:hypothetical protein